MCNKGMVKSFEQMQSEDLSPDAIAYACTLNACGTTQEVDLGEKNHDEIASQGLLEKHVNLGVLKKIQEVFDELPIRGPVSWNALIAGYAQEGQGQEALDYYQQMGSEGLSPNAITYAFFLKACGVMLLCTYMKS
ncbi:hypothetical protein GOP47_0005809 [Adiantum capillus-veneris]|uniref:Pentatricopeptide repeat-containing protein n=1 Tax=Adiantum capillus-veneris TaxID=13818 RepID=A0A9D4V6G0_ADICA|nr:hypothetical protein GOP47_0005809 [Adiantum capillus-veneris]